ncbi:HD-GYP domain-containing protein [Sphingosinicella sp. BN140058]|uniref:HD-GYP domain-containing protein n=1 Tax=Sphingosinicella sp. BN140058 TaxID=1892855 RepID=UPI0010116392|nr:HD-GYP domain-containing protein [Sphingosinicella sp. BN140058]QAY78126.1 HD-GYP domain-containing protein [Sphingosinicella sp. BN140058]
MTLKRIHPSQARMGMFVVSFEGSWFDHPFWKRRVLISTEVDLKAVLDSKVPALMIDTGRGVDVAPVLPEGRVARFEPPNTVGRSPSEAPASGTPDGMPREDLARAEASLVVNRSKEVMRGVFDGARLGKAIESEAVVAVVADISAAIQNNRAAFLRVIRLKSKDEYTYLHSIAVCALMVNLAGHLGLDPPAIADLGTAGLLHDIGKAKIAAEVLNKPARLSKEEFAAIQAHAEQGYRLLLGASGVPDVALDVCRHHHEKVDGTGYPHRLRGDKISLGARMGAICDVYDALTSNRPYKNAWSPAEAMAAMHGWAGTFDPTLLSVFMQSIGVFPPGIVVRLSSDRLGIVLEQRRPATRAQILIFYCIATRKWIPPETVIIGDGAPGIAEPVEPSLWGIAEEELTAFQLRFGVSSKMSAAARRWPRVGPEHPAAGPLNLHS